MTQNYWQNRIGRRRVLRGAGLGLTGVAAAALIGCGGSDDPASTASATSSGGSGGSGGGGSSSTASPEVAGIMAPVVDSSAEAVRGGIFKGYTGSDTNSWDPHASNSTIGVAGHSSWAYPLLFEMVPEIAGELPSVPVQGQLVESYEFADPTTLVVTLRQNAKWDADAPTSSRPVDAEDVAFSWTRFAANSLTRGSLSNAANAAAPVLAMNAIDDRRVEIKTAFSSGLLLPLLANQSSFQVLPREADGGFDPNTQIFGAGPWKLSRHDPDVAIEWRRNPNYWNPDRPFLDGVNAAIISEPAQQFAQFRSGNIWGGSTGNSPIIQADVIGMKKDFPELEVYRGLSRMSPFTYSFGLRPDSPFRDIRVRRAVSMLLDRQAIVEVFDSAINFIDEGWPVEINYPNLGIAKGAGAMWVDPLGPEMTAEGRAVFEFNRDEAIKLLDAAGIGTYATDMIIIRDRYGPEWPRIAEAYLAELNATGRFKINPVTPPSWAEWTRDYFYSQGDFEGLAFCTAVEGQVPAQHLVETYHSGGTYQHGAFKRDPQSIEGIAESNALIERIAQSLDFDEQNDLMRQWQIEIAPYVHQVSVPNKSATEPFSLYWPWTKNLGSWRVRGNASTVQMANTWIGDEAKRKA